MIWQSQNAVTRQEWIAVIAPSQPEALLNLGQFCMTEGVEIDLSQMTWERLRSATLNGVPLFPDEPQKAFRIEAPITTKREPS